MQAIHSFLKNIRRYLPAIFFFGGFLWDALTIGRQVTSTDLYFLSAYWLGAGLILFVISHPNYVLADAAYFPVWVRKPYLHFKVSRFYWPNFPYFLLQFLYGSLLSALFILYFKSTSHSWAWLLSLALGVLLVLNEFLEESYRKFTLSWALFGLCSMLLFNFVLPFVLGSIHAAWFYLSTLLGAAAAYLLYRKTPYMGSIKPVGGIAALLMLAYTLDMIPPVPLVKREIAMAYNLQKMGNQYVLTQQASPWWVFWRATSDDLSVQAGQRVYCFSSVFAPKGLKTKLFHRWQYHGKKGWQTMSRAGFTLSGGRQDGFRGYTYKTNLPAGDWRVLIETETNKTVAIYPFKVQTKTGQFAQVVRSY